MIMVCNSYFFYSYETAWSHCVDVGPKTEGGFFSNTGQIICIFQNIPNVDYISEICLAPVWKTRMSLNIEF